METVNLTNPEEEKISKETAPPTLQSDMMDQGPKVHDEMDQSLREFVQKVRKTSNKATENVRSCFDAVMAAAVIGIVTSVLNGLGLLLCIGTLVYCYVMTSLGFDLGGYRNWKNDDHEISFYRIMDVLMIQGWITLGLILAVLEFSLSIVLAHGACKKLVNHVQAYFIYGCIRTTLLFITSFCLFAIIWDNSPGQLALVIAFTSLFVTILAYCAYKNIKRSSESPSKPEEISQDKSLATSTRSYLKVKISSMFLGIILSVVYGVLALAFAGGMVFVIWNSSLAYDLSGKKHVAKEGEYAPKFTPDEVYDIVTLYSLLAIGVVVALLECSLSVTAVVGVAKNNVAALNVYVIYGVIKTVVMIPMSVALLCTLVSYKVFGYIALAVSISAILSTLVFYGVARSFRHATSEYCKMDNIVLVQ